MKKDVKQRLDEIIPVHAENKAMLEDYKKICDEENAEIKSLMLNHNLDNYTIGEYTAKTTTVTRKTLDEERLLNVFNSDSDVRSVLLSKGIIKTREYVDIDALEGYLYELGNDVKFTDAKTKLLNLLDSCMNRKEVVTLRIIKAKEKK